MGNNELATAAKKAMAKARADDAQSPEPFHDAVTRVVNDALAKGVTPDMILAGRGLLPKGFFHGTYYGIATHAAEQLVSPYHLLVLSKGVVLARLFVEPLPEDAVVMPVEVDEDSEKASPVPEDPPTSKTVADELHEREVQKRAKQIDETAKQKHAAPPYTTRTECPDRKTFEVPEGHEAVRDEEGRATGEVRPVVIADEGLAPEHGGAEPQRPYNPVIQDWVCRLPFTQQSVLLSAMRNADGVEKGHPSKDLIRWFRRCVVLSAFDGRALTNPYEPGGGSYTGPLRDDQTLEDAADAFLRARDGMSLHYYAHAMHAFEIVAYHHPDDTIGEFWLAVYERMALALHLRPESCSDMDQRLGDSESDWRRWEDSAGGCST